MPTYEYACTSCRRHFEVVQSFSDAPLDTCEECGGSLKRVFHPVGIVLKGSGFYATDNRSGKKSTTAATPKGSTDSKESTSSSDTSSTSTASTSTDASAS